MPIKVSSRLILRGLRTFAPPLARPFTLIHNIWRPLHNVTRILARFGRPFQRVQLFPSALHVDSKMSSGVAPQNRLARAKSPYLLQHASNPVDWYEWSDEAFKRAAEENKPIFLSVGYSACHWCHVLAHESFENDEIARVMNEHFINIKVDREERPDVDRLYMTYVQATSGRGGWPMSVWLTPELAPFFAGTYFPTSTFKLLCEKIASTWASDPRKVRDHADSVIQQLRNVTQTETTTPFGQIDLRAASKKLFDKWEQDFDPKYAGFGDAPKFPSPSLCFNPLLRHAYYTDISEEKTKAVDMVAQTLLAIYRGGINDHVGKGIARYSVDAEWRLPHFEKMLYDQAQLTASALECSLLVKDPEIKNELQRMAADIIEYAERDIRSPRGAFYSAEDADSLPVKTATAKQEGAFYVWRKSEIDNILGEHSQLFADYFGIKESGNIDPANDAHGELHDQNQLYVHIPLTELAKKHGISIPEAEKIIEASLGKLKQYRDANRPRPQIDDKIVTAWNGLMLTALSLAASILPPDMVYRNNVGIASSSLKMAESIASFAKDYLWNTSRRELSRSWRDGPGPAGVCEDYAALVTGLLDLYEATGDEEHLLFAKELQERQDELFWDDNGGGYFASRADDRHILIRLKESQDGAEPSTPSLSVSNLYRLSYLITAEESQMKTRAEKLVASQTNILNRAPHVLGMMLGASHIGARGMKQIIVTGTRGDAETEDVLRAIRSHFVPNRSLIFIDPAAPPTALAKHNQVVHSLIDGLSGKDIASLTLPEVRICDGHACGLPLRKDELKNLMV